jgi:cyclopropane fatty-acyl-phospholipid synthase-like methyltransferase
MLSPPSGAALRNRDPIADVLVRVLPESGTVLEIASGAGVHVAHFAMRMPSLTWQPTEASEAALAEIDERVESPSNVLPAQKLDVLAPWPVTRVDAIVCINMIHASVPETLPALMRGAGAALSGGGVLVTYGPYRIDGQLSESNIEFDAWLKRERDPRWGVRDLEDVVSAAASNGLTLEERVAMPANNSMLVFRHSGRSC